jgi:hypothetical protein
MNCAFSTGELSESESRTAKPPAPSVAEAGAANWKINPAATARDKANLRNMDAFLPKPDCRKLRLNAR